eukprot:10326266-Alexandrium_andersonii.AAC.1
MVDGPYMPSPSSDPSEPASAGAGLADAGRSYDPTPQAPPNGRLTAAGGSAGSPSWPVVGSSTSRVCDAGTKGRDADGAAAGEGRGDCVGVGSGAAG